MFGLADTLQESLIFLALFFIICAIVQSKEVNKHIDRINQENSSRYNIPQLPTASYYSLIFCAVILVLALILPIVKR